jgi:2-polyprenyl-3-methyl-5-hydroxy-6-metoxy-1,4-benzoquinol methylase
MDLKEADILGDSIESHWYYQAKAKAMVNLLKGLQPYKILDVGSGSAFFSRYLLNQTEAQECWCIDTSYASDTIEIVGSKKIHFQREVNKVDVGLVLLMDVLEHVEDDIGLLQACLAKVPRGTKFLISVPAFQFLWSAHDVFLEHKRRYTLSEIELVAKEAGLANICGAYYFSAIFPIALTSRLISKMYRKSNLPHSQLSKHHWLINKLLVLLCEVELPFMPHNRLAGLTAFCIAEKP